MTKLQTTVAAQLATYHHRRWVSADTLAGDLERKKHMVVRKLHQLLNDDIVEQREDHDAYRLTSTGRQALKE